VLLDKTMPSGQPEEFEQRQKSHLTAFAGDGFFAVACLYVFCDFETK